MFMLTDQKVLITGGTAGIGKEIALAFARQGAHVAIFGTNEERAKQVVEEMEKAKTSEGQRFFYFIVDIASKPAVDTAIATVLTHFGKVDVLVNNAGITRDTLLMKMSEEDWDMVQSVNLKSVYNTCQALARTMIKAKGGKIINISSVVGLTGNAGQVNYAASKSGMIGFTKAFALEVASRNIRVNCVAPGFIETRMTEALSEEQKKTISQKIPMNRLGQTQDIAHAVLFLASHLSDYITGQVLTVDGGMVM